MASRFETQMTTPRETTVCVELTCDLCGPDLTIMAATDVEPGPTSRTASTRCVLC